MEKSKYNIIFQKLHYLFIKTKILHQEKKFETFSLFFIFFCIKRKIMENILTSKVEKPENKK